MVGVDKLTVDGCWLPVAGELDQRLDTGVEIEWVTGCRVDPAVDHCALGDCQLMAVHSDTERA